MPKTIESKDFRRYWLFKLEPLFCGILNIKNYSDEILGQCSFPLAGKVDASGSTNSPGNISVDVRATEDFFPCNQFTSWFFFPLVFLGPYQRIGLTVVVLISFSRRNSKICHLWTKRKIWFFFFSVNLYSSS